MIRSLLDLSLLNSAFRMIAPILLAALGGLMCGQVKVFNIALEGTMLIGAFTAVAASYYSGNALVGVACAGLVGMLFSLLLALLIVTLRQNSMVVGIALNLLANGLTTFLLMRLFGVRGSFTSPRIAGLPGLRIPVLSSIPVLGAVLSGHSWVVYLSWGLVVAVSVLLFRTVAGLRIRGVGLDDEAARTLGVDVTMVRYAALGLCGVLVGMAGAQLSLGQVTLYVEGMSAGRGWIALVAVMLGNAIPTRVFVASLVFGFSDAVSYRLQGMRLPYQFANMIPYLSTLLVFLVSQKRSGKDVEVMGRS